MVGATLGGLALLPGLGLVLLIGPERRVGLAILASLALALLEEGLQFFSPVRSADLTDLLSDLAGLLFFWWLSQKIVDRNAKLSK